MLYTELAVGLQWEKAVFGVHSSQYKNRIPPMSRIQATRRVISEQYRFRWNPSSPHTKVGKELLECIKSHLPTDKAKDLRLYCSLGTALDLYHNTDGFFMLQNDVLPVDLKSGSVPHDYINSSFLLMMRECNGFTMWRACRKIAEILSRKDTDTSYIYSLNGTHSERW